MNKNNYNKYDIVKIIFFIIIIILLSLLVRIDATEHTHGCHGEFIETELCLSVSPSAMTCYTEKYYRGRNLCKSGWRELYKE